MYHIELQSLWVKQVIIANTCRPPVGFSPRLFRLLKEDLRTIPELTLLLHIPDEDHAELTVCDF